MAGKRGLGSGLDTLIPQSKQVQKKEITKEIIKEVDKIDINKIEPNGNQPRKNFNEDSLLELAESIKQHGLIEPIIVQKGKEGFFKIIAGERRWRAAKIAGLKEIPVVIKDYTAQEIMEIALIENIQREDLNPIEEAEAYQKLIEEYQLKQDEVAERVSKSRVAITNALRLLKLDERVRDFLIEDKIKSGHARALLGMKVFDEKLSVRETEKLVKKILSGNTTDKKEEITKEQKQIQIVYADYEEKLKTIMGTKVNINQGKKGKGKIEIEFYSPEEFERIYEMMSHLK